MVAGHRLDFWPSRKKFQYRGKVRRGDVFKFIAIKEETPHHRRGHQMSHAVVRTSPKAPARKFIGHCTKCGRDGLGLSAALEDCPADALVSDEAALMDILKAPTDEATK